MCKYLCGVLTSSPSGHQDGRSGSYSGSTFSFLRNLCTYFHEGCSSLHGHQQCRRVPSSIHPHVCYLLTYPSLVPLLAHSTTFFIFLVNTLIFFSRICEASITQTKAIECSNLPRIPSVRLTYILWATVLATFVLLWHDKKQFQGERASSGSQSEGLQSTVVGGKAWSQGRQEAVPLLLQSGSRELTSSEARPQGLPLVTHLLLRCSLPKDSTNCQTSSTNWGPSVQTHEPVREHFTPNHSDY